MSIWCSTFEMETGPGGEIAERPGERAPIAYQGSHIRPKPDDPRRGSLHLAEIAPHIGLYWPGFLRLGVAEEDTRLTPSAPSTNPDPRLSGARAYDLSKPAIIPPQTTVLLDREQVAALRDELSRWLSRVGIDAVVFSEGSHIISQCVQVDLATSADSEGELVERAASQLRSQLALDRRHGRMPFSTNRPAPERFRRLLHSSDEDPWETVELDEFGNVVLRLHRRALPPKEAAG